MARRASKRGAGGTPAVRALAAAGVAFSEHPYEHDPDHRSFGMEAAEALGLDPDSVFKTLLAEVDAALVVAVLPVTAQLDLKALASVVAGKRATLAKPPDAERVTGYVVGGISPLGQRKALPTVVDSSAEALETMYVSGGRRGFELGVAPADLIALTRATVACVTAPAR